MPAPPWHMYPAAQVPEIVPSSQYFVAGQLVHSLAARRPVKLLHEPAGQSVPCTSPPAQKRLDGQTRGREVLEVGQIFPTGHGGHTPRP